MSNAPELDAAGLPEELSPLDQILHRGEAIRAPARAS